MREPPITMMDVLARFRVALGWVCAPLVLVLADPSRESLVAGTLVALAGEGIRVWAAGHLNKSREVTASGPYRYVAHPLYVGSSVMGLGLAIASANGLAAALIAFYLAVTLRAAIRSEEAFLRRQFGERYDAYRSQDAVDTARRFSFAQAMTNREYRAVIGLVAAMLLLALKATYNGMLWRAAAGS